MLQTYGMAAYFLLSFQLMITYVAPKGEEFTMGFYLDDRGGPLGEAIRILTYDDLETLSRLDAGAWVFAGLDRLTQGQRELADVVWRTLEASRMPVRLLNRPNKVMLRAPLLRTLHERGINRFKAVPPAERSVDLTFPVFVREADAHTGNLTPLLRDRSALERALTRLRLRGYAPDELLVVEFVDSSDAAGIFRKYSSYFVDGVVIPKALRFSTEWMLKARFSFWDKEKVREQEEWATRNEWAGEVASIFRTAKIDYGRMDYAVVDGRLQVWEINMNPTVTRGTGTNKPEAMKAMKSERAKVSDAFHRAFREATLALDPGTWGDLHVPFVPPSALLGRIDAERQERARVLRRREWRARFASRLGKLRPSLPGVRPVHTQVARQPQ
jgi:hypothetical protein